MVSSHQTCDFLSLSAGGESSNSGKCVKLSGQPHFPFMHPQASHHSVMPFGFPRVPQMTPYPEKLSSAAAQQVHSSHLFSRIHHSSVPIYLLSVVAVLNFHIISIT